MVYKFIFFPSVAAGAGEVVNLSLMDLAYMQDMSSAICNNTNINDTKRLVDKRDSKLYWVAKLADNNCWMTQNLDLDLTEEGLTTELSDITEDWNSTTNPTYPPIATQTESPSGFNNTSNEEQGYNVVLSYDQGVKVCTGYGKGCVDPTTENYDTHYLRGNLYAFNAATAGKSASVTANGVTVTGSSICPKNWQLPLGGSSNSTKSKSFYYLLNKYGLTSSASGIDVNGIAYDVALSPLYFTYSGFVHNASLAYGGSVGRYWTSRSSNAAQANNLYLSTEVSASTGISYRYYGYSVRCVAK